MASPRRNHTKNVYKSSIVFDDGALYHLQHTRTHSHHLYINSVPPGIPPTFMQLDVVVFPLLFRAIWFVFVYHHRIAFELWSSSSLCLWLFFLLYIYTPHGLTLFSTTVSLSFPLFLLTSWGTVGEGTRLNTQPTFHNLFTPFLSSISGSGFLYSICA